MSDTPSSWRDPRYIATIVGVIATAALYFFHGVTQAGPTTGEITTVLLVVFVPSWIAYEIARRSG